MTQGVDTGLTGLPERLAERSRAIPNSHAPIPGEFVLYWMHHAVRGHENPALDVAVLQGNRLGLPVLVYQGLIDTTATGITPSSSKVHATLIVS